MLVWKLKKHVLKMKVHKVEKILKGRQDSITFKGS